MIKNPFHRTRNRVTTSVAVAGFSVLGLGACTVSTPVPVATTRTVACPGPNKPANSLPGSVLVSAVNVTTFGSGRVTCSVSVDGTPLSSGQIAALSGAGITVVDSITERLYSPPRPGLDCAGMLPVDDPSQPDSRWCVEAGTRVVVLAFSGVTSTHVGLSIDFPADCRYSSLEANRTAGVWTLGDPMTAIC